jgi:acyl-CoA thioester hydrolase
MTFQPTGKPFEWTGKVYFGDTDAAKVVYHGRYVNWLEAARIDFLEHIGYPYPDLVKKNVGLVPVNVNINYLKPLRFGDTFKLLSKFVKVSKASTTIASQFVMNGQCHVEASVKLACINEATWRPMAIPTEFIQKLTSFEDEPLI